MTHGHDVTPVTHPCELPKAGQGRPVGPFCASNLWKILGRVPHPAFAWRGGVFRFSPEKTHQQRANQRPTPTRYWPRTLDRRRPFPASPCDVVGTTLRGVHPSRSSV